MRLKASPNTRDSTSGQFTAKHSQHGTPEYVAWDHMKSRCTNPGHKQYESYGGRGITVCDRWADFAAFYEDMGPRPTELHTLDRRDNDRGYSKENCRWATRTEQNRNHRANRMISYQGKTQCVAAWAQELGVADSVIRVRLARGWDTERILTTRRREYPAQITRP